MKAKTSSPDGKLRFRLASGMMGVLFVSAAVTQAKLHTVEREGTLALAKESRRFIVERKDKARRGSIFASDGKALAQDSSTYQLVVNFRKVPHSDAFFMDLGRATGIPASEFAALAVDGARTVTWQEPISASQADEVRKVRSRWRADGLSPDENEKREYPLGAAAACLVGIQLDMKMKDRPDAVRTGLEASKNQILQGQDGERVGMTDRRGGLLPMRTIDEGTPRIDGKDLTLTIDSELQKSAFEAVKKAVEKHKAADGSAIVIDPKTGDVLAMANWPSFDPNQRQNSEFGYNPAYMAQLEPGSTFKILTLAKAMDLGRVSMGSTFYCRGSMIASPRAKPVTCDAHGRAGGHGMLDPVKAIAKSCNVWAATWAQAITRPTMIEYVEDLGLLEKTKIGVPGEVQGLFRRDEYAKQLQLAHVGFGQSITATPIGLASAFSMIANDGVRMKPRLVKKIGKTTVPLEEGTRMISSDTAKKVLDCMEAVVETDIGTGNKLRIPGYRLGGKTGTAQKVGAKKGGYVSNFIGFVPAQKPEAVVLVMVNDPQVGYYGGEVAGPAFVEIARAAIRRLRIEPTER